MAEKFWEAGFKYADELLGKWEELGYPEEAEDTETTCMAGALKEMWEAVLTLHNEKAGDEDPEFQVTGIEFFECCLDEVEENLESLAPNWNN